MQSPDVRARPIAWAGAAIAATVALAVAVVFLLLHLWQVPPGADRSQRPDALPAQGPLLQSAPQPDLAQVRAEQQRQLEAIGWVDAKQGIVRIPVQDAMRLLAPPPERKP